MPAKMQQRAAEAEHNISERASIQGGAPQRGSSCERAAVRIGAHQCCGQEAEGRRAGAREQRSERELLSRAEAREQRSERELLSKAEAREQRSERELLSKAEAREQRSERELLSRAVAREQRSERELLSRAEAREQQSERELLSRAEAREQRSERELLSRAEAREQQSERELLSKAEARERRSGREPLSRAEASEQQSEGEPLEPEYDHRFDKIANVKAIVGSLSIAQEDGWRCKVSSCTGDFHRLKDCPQFGRMDPKDRMALVERLMLCVACLTPGHNRSARKCPYEEERVDACREPACKASHHRLLHIKGGRKRQSTREEAHPEAADTLRASHQAEEEGWSCKVRTCRAELHKLRECEKFRELSPAARCDLVRRHGLCQVCLRVCQAEGKNCRWRNRIRMELCRENRCRRKHHQLLHVEKGLEEERPDRKSVV